MKKTKYSSLLDSDLNDFEESSISFVKTLAGKEDLSMKIYDKFNLSSNVLNNSFDIVLSKDFFKSESDYYYFSNFIVVLLNSLYNTSTRSIASLNSNESLYKKFDVFVFEYYFLFERYSLEEKLGIAKEIIEFEINSESSIQRNPNIPIDKLNSVRLFSSGVKTNLSTVNNSLAEFYLDFLVFWSSIIEEYPNINLKPMNVFYSIFAVLLLKEYKLRLENYCKKLDIKHNSLLINELSKLLYPILRFSYSKLFFDKSNKVNLKFDGVGLEKMLHSRAGYSNYFSFSMEEKERLFKEFLECSSYDSRQLLFELVLKDFRSYNYSNIDLVNLLLNCKDENIKNIVSELKVILTSKVKQVTFTELILKDLNLSLDFLKLISTVGSSNKDGNLESSSEKVYTLIESFLPVLIQSFIISLDKAIILKHSMSLACIFYIPLITGIINEKYFLQ